MSSENQVEAKVAIGWVIQPSRVESETRLAEQVESASERLREHLAGQFGDFLWAVETKNRRAVPADHGGIDPIDLIETGCGEKISRGWDFAIVVTDAVLVARERPFTVGIPSSALETVVLTTARFTAEEESTELRIAALAQYLLGHVLGLEPHEPGAMRRLASSGVTTLEEFDEADRALVNRRLEEVADLRLEERRHTLNRVLFGLSAFFANPRGVLTDVVGYQPWLQPFRLGRLTAAAFVTTLLLFLGAESWEMGVGMSPAVSVSVALLAVLGATLFLYRGQNLTELTRHRVLSEQLARSHVVLLLCLTIGMVTLWSLLFVSSFGITAVIPRQVVERWIGGDLDVVARLKFSIFTATIGTLAGALGGNLEDEDDFKARFLFDEEA